MFGDVLQNMQKEKPNYRNKTIYRNSVWSLIFKLGSLLISFMTAPMLLNLLGETKYGAWVTMLSLISWIYYCDVGIGGSMRNKITMSIAEEDYARARKFVSVSYASIGLISMGVFVAFFFLSRIIDICGFFEIQVSGEDMNLCLTVAVLYACVNFTISLVNNVLYAVQRAASVGFFGALAQIFFWGMLAIFTLTGDKTILLIAIAEGTSQLLKNLIETVYVYIKYPQLRFSHKDIDWSYSKEIISLGLMMFINQIAALILNTTDNLIISKYLTVADVTPYSFCYKYFNMINAVYMALITPLLSAYTMAYAKGDIKWIKTTIKKNFMLYGVFMAGTLAATPLFEGFAFIWLHKKLNYEKGLIVWTMVYFLLLMFNHIWATILTGFGKIRASTMLAVASSLINIPASIFLATQLGLGTAGVILGSVLCLLPSTVVSPIVTVREIKRAVKE